MMEFRVVIPKRVTNPTSEAKSPTAIASAIATASAGDLVLIAGKGHETTQTVGAQVLPFDDRAVAREALGIRRQRFGVG